MRMILVVFSTLYTHTIFKHTHNPCGKRKKKVNPLVSVCTFYLLHLLLSNSHGCSAYISSSNESFNKVDLTSNCMVNFFKRLQINILFSNVSKQISCMPSSQKIYNQEKYIYIDKEVIKYSQLHHYYSKNFTIKNK